MESIAVIPSQLLDQCGRFHGFRSWDQRYLELILNKNVEFRERDAMEKDPNFKQLIPYILIRHNGHYFGYTRSKMAGESKLRGKKSIGIGGHVNTNDRDRTVGSLHPFNNMPGLDVNNYVVRGMEREFDEEVYLHEDAATDQSLCNVISNKIVGIVNHDDTDVAKVHVGIVFLIEVDAYCASTNDDNLVDTQFYPVKQLRSEINLFEGWSQFIIDSLSVDGGLINDNGSVS